MEEYHIQSSLFNFSLPQSNILGLPSQNTQAVADGNRLLLKPLNIDQHEIKCKREVNKTIILLTIIFQVQLIGLSNYINCYNWMIKDI